MFESTLVIFNPLEMSEPKNWPFVAGGRAPCHPPGVPEVTFAEKKTFKSEILELPNLQPHWKYRFININHTKINYVHIPYYSNIP